MEESHHIDTLPYLHRHALESIFQFFRIGELHTLMRVSHEWLSAVCSMRGVGARLDRWCDGFELNVIFSSRLSRHVGLLRGNFSPPHLMHVAIPSGN